MKLIVIINKVLNSIKNFWVALIYGMKNTEDIVFTQSGISNDANGSTINQTIKERSVAKSLLKGEVTQDVEELRYRNYLVDRESKQYEYYTPTLAIKRDVNDSKFVTYLNDDNLELITIQINTPIDNGINSIKVDKEGTFKSYELMPSKHSYDIKLTRGEFVPRYYLEEYTKRLAVRKLDDTDKVILDFYVSKYPNDKDFKSKGFVREIEKIRDEKLRSDVIDLQKVGFVTSHAYKMDDLLEFEFDNIIFKQINEFDGDYVISFKARVIKNGIDLTVKYYNKAMADKYTNKVKKELVLDLSASESNKVYKCENCGKEIIYDSQEIDYMPIFEPKDILDDEVINDDNFHPTEFLDAQICEQTFGKVLCHDCLSKMLKIDNTI